MMMYSLLMYGEILTVTFDWKRALLMFKQKALQASEAKNALLCNGMSEYLFFTEENDIPFGTLPHLVLQRWNPESGKAHNLTSQQRAELTAFYEEMLKGRHDDE